jgi:thioredoxin 2
MTEKIKVSCLHCGATNNYPLEAEGKTVVCGRCKNPLPEPGAVLEPSLEEVRVLLQSGRLPLIIDFYSTTCAPCRMMHPIVERLARRRRGELMTLRVNVETNPHLASEFAIQAVPTYVVHAQGYERGRTSGAMPETDFSLWVAGKT